MDLPASVYVVVGILVVTNLGTIGTMLVFIFKCGVFVSDTKSGIKDAKETAVRAHQRIDQIDPHLRGG
jgi:fructose-specific phosphotransferase system IIC component